MMWRPERNSSFLGGQVFGGPGRAARSGAGAVLARRSRVILRGAIGRNSVLSAGELAPVAVAGSGRSAEGDEDRAHWAAAHGCEWPGALEALSRRAREAGVPLRIGSAELAGSPWLASLGWAGERVPAFRRVAAAPAWVLRVPAGWVAVVREWIEEDGRLQAAGTPAIVLEESALALLPADPRAPSCWPSADAWRHAARVVFPCAAGGRAVPLSRSALVPESPEDLMARLQARPAPGCSAMPADRAAMVARDLLEAARAWTADPGVFWLVERAAHGLAPEEASARARDRGLRVRPACVQRSAGCGAAVGGTVVRGLDEACAASTAAAVVTERSRAGAFAGPVELVTRVRRRDVGWKELARLASAGAFEIFGEARGSLVRNIAGHLLVAVRSGFVPVPREAAPRSSRVLSRSRAWRVPVPAPGS